MSYFNTIIRAIETITQEEYYQSWGKAKEVNNDDGVTFTILAVCLSIGMWAYEGGWVALVLSKLWSGFPTLLTVAQLLAGFTMLVPIIFSMTMMLTIVGIWAMRQKKPSFSLM
mmetsp:Transcript_14164/g.22580  ORF Transcript_14164/g.22580 Transcript_14164/m.22580 type:complete len:113 (+) Transcript_14164:255-593(+)